jgi:hypothetical protein
MARGCFERDSEAHCNVFSSQSVRHQPQNFDFAAAQRLDYGRLVRGPGGEKVAHHMRGAQRAWPALPIASQGTPSGKTRISPSVDTWQCEFVNGQEGRSARNPWQQSQFPVGPLATASEDQFHVLCAKRSSSGECRPHMSLRSITARDRSALQAAHDRVISRGIAPRDGERRRIGKLQQKGIARFIPKRSCDCPSLHDSQYTSRGGMRIDPYSERLQREAEH